MDNKTNTAVVNAKSVPISTKMSVEICSAVKGKNLVQARRILHDVLNMKRALPIKRFNADLGHKPGMASGRYPINASKAFLNLLDSVEANAQNKGLNVNDLIIVHAKADKGEARWHFGRKGRAKMKNTHVSLIVEEKKSQSQGVKK